MKAFRCHNNLQLHIQSRKSQQLPTKRKEFNIGKNSQVGKFFRKRNFNLRWKKTRRQTSEKVIEECRGVEKKLEKPTDGRIEQQRKSFLGKNHLQNGNPEVGC